MEKTDRYLNFTREMKNLEYKFYSNKVLYGKTIEKPKWKLEEVEVRGRIEVI